MMTRALTATILIVVLFGACSCGGGGGNGNISSAVTTPLTTTTSTSLPGTVYNIPKNSDTTLNQDSVRVFIPAGTFSADSQVGITASPNSDKPANGNFVTDPNVPAINIATKDQPKSGIYVSVSGPHSRANARSITTLMARRLQSGFLHVIGYMDNTLGMIQIPATEFDPLAGHFEVGGFTVNVQLTDDEEQYGFIQYKTDSSASNSESMLCLVHGYNTGAARMDKVAEKFAGLHRYRQIIEFQYPFRRQTDEVARVLGYTLRSLMSKGYYIDIFAHSRGVVVSRYMLENILSYKETFHVPKLYAVCGANQGSYLSTAAFVVALWDDVLNGPSQSSNYGLIGFDSPAAQEMMPGSAFLAQLNSPELARPIETTIINVAASTDTIVGTSSGLADQVCEEAIVRNSLFRYTALSFGHSYMIDSALGIDTMFGYLMKNTDIRATNITTDLVKGSDNGWDAPFGVSNDTTGSLVLKDVLLEDHDANGKLIGHYYYSPSASGHLSRSYCQANLTLPPGSTNLTCHLWPNGPGSSMKSVSDNFKAHTLAFQPRIAMNGGVRSIGTGYVQCFYGSIKPGGGVLE